MKARSVFDVRTLLGTSSFLDWSRRYIRVLSELDALHDTDEDCVVHAVLRAGEFEDLSGQAEAAYRALDESFEALSAFELQRQHTTDVWVALEHAANDLEVHRQRASDVRQTLTARRADHGGDQEQLRGELERLEVTIHEAARDVERLREKLGANEARRQQMWDEVEDTWEQAFRANLASKEYAYQARRHQARARELANEQMGQSARDRSGGSGLEERGAPLGTRLDELSAQRETLIAEAEQDLGCVLIESFLYWPHAGEVSAVLCVPLVDEPKHFNIQVTALQLYEIDRNKGLEFIEPVPEEAADDDDPRLEAFFLLGRHGAVSKRPPPSP